MLSYIEKNRYIRSVVFFIEVNGNFLASYVHLRTLKPTCHLPFNLLNAEEKLVSFQFWFIANIILKNNHSTFHSPVLPDNSRFKQGYVFIILELSELCHLFFQTLQLLINLSVSLFSDIVCMLLVQV